MHHLAGHLASAELASPGLAPPYLGLVISGGHTALYRIARGGPASRCSGETRDDAVGEAFDKVAKLLGLAYPGRAGGRARRRRAATRRPSTSRARWPGAPGSTSPSAGSRPRSRSRSSASARSGPLGARQVADLAASFEQAAVDVLVARARRALAAEAGAARRLAVVGGVAANRRLRAAFEAAGARRTASR